MKKKKSNFSLSHHISRIPLGVVWLVAVIVLIVMYILFIASPVKTDKTISIGDGEAIITVTDDLARKHLIQNESVFRTLVLLRGNKIMRGTYDIPRGSSVWVIARMMSHGDVAMTTVLIPEGLTTKQIVGVLDDNPNLVGAACQPADNCPGDGTLFPDTYRVPKGTARADVLKLMSDKMITVRDNIQKNWTRMGKDFPKPLKTWDDVITLASIVQKETPQVSEMPMVASVYLNRLKTGMRLQADPTVVYALTDCLGDMRGNPLLRSQLSTDSPYNTYAHYGLPPAPIANVGRDAIRAVLNPSDTNYLYFVANGRGGHAFANTLDEHNANCAVWRKIKGSK